MGFKLNPYDLCVANSQIKGKQCTVAWYVDNNKISHVDDTVVTNIIEMIEVKFRKMTVTRGKHHVFLGMDITFNDNDGTVTILMKGYLKEAIADSGMDAPRLRQRRRRKTCSPLTTDPRNLTNDKAQFFTLLSRNYFTFPKELVPTLSWLLLSTAPGSCAARSRIGKS